MKNRGQVVDFGNCSNTSNNPIIVFEERKSKITLLLFERHLLKYPGK
jgi:hypothetical protein